MLNVRGPMVYNKYLNVSMRKKLFFDIFNDSYNTDNESSTSSGSSSSGYFQNLDNLILNEKKFSKNMFDPVLHSMK